jgi:hypothetical protein
MPFWPMVKLSIRAIHSMGCILTSGLLWTAALGPVLRDALQ